MPPVWTDLAGAAALVKDGDLVALGGHTRAAPMALIRELIRQGRRRLGLITVPTSAARTASRTRTWPVPRSTATVMT